MTTHITNTPISHLDDAGFRAWISEIHNSLLTVGLIQTSDAGQVNFATATRPATSSVYNVYSIYRFNDSQQSNCPIFIKFYFMTQTTNTARINIEIGNGTDGSGNILNSNVFQGIQITKQVTSNTENSTVNRLSYFSHSDGFFAMSIKNGFGATTPNWAFLIINRSCNDDATINSNSFNIIYQNSTTASGTTSRTFINSITSWTHTTAFHTNLLAVNNDTSTFVGDDAQIFLSYSFEPRIRPVFGTVLVKLSEFGSDSTFQTKVYGTSNRTFINVGSSMSNVGNNIGSNWSLAFLWE